MNGVARCQIVPLTGRQVSFQIDDREVLRWNFGDDYPRPCFFPVISPAGALLTRMGHPGAPDHDHHQSVWFAHHQVLGIDFWGNTSGARIRQSQWFAYEDSDEFCRMAVELLWLDGHDPAPLLKQELVCEVAPTGGAREYTIELQSRFVPMSEVLEFGKTNFGFLAVRVARSVAASFGGGILQSSTGTRTEPQLFEQEAKWMSYSGPTNRQGTQIEGITYFDHPNNPGQPTGWHVRDDGWMCASPCMKSGLLISAADPLELRYLLHVHAGPVDAVRADRLLADFSERPPLQLARSSRPHTRWEITRAAVSGAP